MPEGQRSVAATEIVWTIKPIFTVWPLQTLVADP